MRTTKQAMQEIGTLLSVELPKSAELKVEEVLQLKTISAGSTFELACMAYTLGYLRGKKNKMAAGAANTNRRA